MDRRHFLTLSAAALLTAGCARLEQPAGSTAPTSAGGASAVPSTGSTPASTPLGAATIGLTYIPNVQFSPAYVATADKAFGPAEVTLRHHGEQEGLFTAMASGQELFVIAGADEMTQAVAQGADLTAVASYYAQHPVRVIARHDAGIRTLADLRGKRVGVPGRYGSSWFGLLVALQTAGLAQSDVTIQEIGYTAAAAMAGKKVDAIVGFTNNDTVQLRRSGLEVDELAVAPDVPLVGVCLITTRALVDSNPALVRAVRDGIVHGMAAVAADPQRAMDVTKQWVPTLGEKGQADAARATLDATIPLLKNPATGTVDGALDSKRFAAMAAFMRQQKLIDADVDPARLYAQLP